MVDKLVNQLSVISDRLVRCLSFVKNKKREANVLERLYYYFKIWLLMSKNSFLVMLTQKKLFVLFLTGKLVRFAFFTAFLYYLVLGADRLAGYSVGQTIFFFLTFNIVDVLAQFLFREVYRFRPLVVSGDFDLILTKPYKALFRALLGGADVIDLVTVPLLIAALVYVGGSLNPTVFHTFLFTLLLINGLLISAAFHIAVLAFGIITLEIDHTIMIFRDLTNLGRLPVDIYRQPLRGIITFFIPVGIMITLPAKALMGLVTFYGVVFSFVLGITAIGLSLRFWDFALKHYTSASS
jgi:ABC-2 type transport system permease protein